MIDNEPQLEATDEEEADEEVSDAESWKQKAIDVITDKLSPSAFERLIQRILREKGFSQVEVTGKTGDGGIDGKGIAKINGILSFHLKKNLLKKVNDIGIYRVESQFN